MQRTCGPQAPGPHAGPTSTSTCTRTHAYSDCTVAAAPMASRRSSRSSTNSRSAAAAAAAGPCSGNRYTFDGASTSGRSHLTGGDSSNGITTPQRTNGVDLWCPIDSRTGCCRRRGGGGGGGGGRRCFAAAQVIVRAAGGDAGARGPPTAAPTDGPLVEEPSTALLLAWFACGNRSLFAAQCLVEVLVELYREGRSFEELQLSLKMATQGGRAVGTRGGGAGDGNLLDETSGEQVVLPPLLQGQEEDVLVSWIALVFLTLEELGVPRDKEPLERQLERQALQQLPQQREGGRQGPATSSGAGQQASSGGAAGMGGVGAGGVAGGSAYLRGMLGYVRQTLGMYDEGQTLARVAGLQGLVQQSASSGASPFLVLMQQYTRLILLTVEVAAAAGLPTSRPLRSPDTVTRPSGYSGAFAGSCNALDLDLGSDLGRGVAERSTAPGSGAAASGSAAPAPAEAEACPARRLAVRLLMAFMGAVLGSSWSLGKFVEGVRVAYDQGLAADELFAQLDEQEFVQSGGLLPLANPSTTALAADSTGSLGPEPRTTAAGGAGADAGQPPLPAPAPQYQITKALLSTWISLSYMTLAQLGVPYPAAGERLGWAWAGFGDPIEALGMNDFVGNVLRQMAGEDPRVVPAPTPPQLQLSAATEPQPESGLGQAGVAASAGTPASSASAADSAPSPAAAVGAAAVAADDDEAVVVGASPGVSPSSEVGSAAPGGGPGRRRGEALMMRVEDDSLAATSTAFRVLSQQVALVQAVCRDLMREDRD